MYNLYMYYNIFYACISIYLYIHTYIHFVIYAYIYIYVYTYIGFEVGYVSYTWPSWLTQQTQKQRIIWGYKILFLDVLFPLHIKKVRCTV